MNAAKAMTQKALEIEDNDPAIPFGNTYRSEKYFFGRLDNR